MAFCRNDCLDKQHSRLAISHRHPASEHGCCAASAVFCTNLQNRFSSALFLDSQSARVDTFGNSGTWLRRRESTLFDRCSTPLQFQAVLFLTTQVKR